MEFFSFTPAHRCVNCLPAECPSSSPTRRASALGRLISVRSRDYFAQHWSPERLRLLGWQLGKGLGMRLTRASRYAIGALVHLARRPVQPLASHDIARTEHIPEWFLLKVLKPIAASGILYSYRGPGGGYQLARPTKSISLLEIIETVEGPIRGLVEPWDSADA